MRQKDLVLSDVLLEGNGPDVKEIFLKPKFRVLAMPFVEGLVLRLLNPSAVTNLQYDWLTFFQNSLFV